MGEFSLPHILILLVVVLIFFGPSRLPGLGKSLGEAIRGFKQGIDPNANNNNDSARNNPPPSQNALHGQSNAALNSASGVDPASRATQEEKDKSRS